MNNAVLVRSSMRTWDFVLVQLLGAGFLAGAAMAAVNKQPTGAVVLGALAGLCLLIGLIGWWLRNRARLWVQDTGTGLLACAVDLEGADRVGSPRGVEYHSFQLVEDRSMKQLVL